MAGIERLGQCVPIDAADVEGLARFAQEADCHLVVVGPELPLSLGLADRLAAQGLQCLALQRPLPGLNHQRPMPRA